MPQINKNITRIERDGIHFYHSGSSYEATTSQSSIPQTIAITCSADTGNNLATTSSLSGYFTIPLLTGSAARGEINLNVYYVTASLFDLIVDADAGNVDTGSAVYFNPTSSDAVTNHNIAVRILKNETATNVATKTYNAIKDNTVMLSLVSASLNTTSNTVTFRNVISGALDTPFVSASGFNFNYVQSGSFGSGSVPGYKASPGTLYQVSASFKISRDTSDVKSVEFLKLSDATNAQEPVFYASGSGKVGFKTRDPLTDVDIRADEFQIKRRLEDKGLRINTEGNIESFDKTPESAATGSEFILNYSRGVAITAAFVNAIYGTSFSNDTDAQNYFNNLSPDDQSGGIKKGEDSGFITPPSVGDTLGAIRWVAQSGSVGDFDERGAGEAAVIKAVVSDGASDGIEADLIFSVADRTGGSVQKLLLDANSQHELTGSLDMGASTLKARTLQAYDNFNTKIQLDTNNIYFFANYSSNVFTISNNAITVNPGGNNFTDFFVEGDTDPNLIATAASVDKVGIGTASPAEKLTVAGNISASGTITSNGNSVVSQSGAFVNNEFIVAVGSSAVTSSDALAVDSDGNLGIGTPNPEVRLHMLGEDAQTTQILMEQFNNSADAPDIRTRRYRGTSASRADVQTGDYLFRLNVHGQDDGSSELYGSMRFDVDGSDQDALEWAISTRDTNSNTADRITIDKDGDVSISGSLSVGTIDGGSF